MRLKSKNKTGLRRAAKTGKSLAQKEKLHELTDHSWHLGFPWKTFVIAVFLALGIVVAALGPGWFSDFQASILARKKAVPTLQPSFTTEPAVPAGRQAGILITAKTGGKNEQKLKDIFRTVFPGIPTSEISYTSPPGRSLMAQLGITEVPTIFFEKIAFEKEPFAKVVKDLFTRSGEYYVLQVSLVSPSGQLRITSLNSAEGAVAIGNPSAPITAYVYSDILCQHCRVNERNHQPEFQKLVSEGLIRVVYADLPENPESTFHATALTCFYEKQHNPEQYLSLRDNLYKRYQISKAYTTRELSRLGVDYKQCNEAAYKTLFRDRREKAAAEGIISVPAVYIGKTGGNEFIRLGGPKNFAELQEVFDDILAAGTTVDSP